MKNLLFFIVIFTLFGCKKENNSIKNNFKKKNSIEERNLFGKVKSIRSMEYDVVDKFGDIQKVNISFSIRFNNYEIFNKEGNVIEYNGYNSDGSLDDKYIYKYDDNGNRIESNGYNSDGSLKSKFIDKYDDNGNKIEYIRYNSDGFLDWKSISKYDDKGNRIESIEDNSNGSLNYTLSYDYEFDKNNNWINRIYYENKIPKTIVERTIEYY